MTVDTARSLEGGCLCGALRFSISGPLGPIGHCHCRTCQKGQSAAFATTARVAWDDFEWQSDESELRSYESTLGKKRSFCARCGSKLFAAWDGEDELILRLGVLDSDPGTRPLVHIWTDHIQDWFDLRSSLPQFPRSVPPRKP